MVRTIVSWLLFGVFGYIWWWAGHGWDYLNTEGNEWSRVFLLLTLVSMVLLILAPRATGPGMFDRLVGTIRTFIPKLPWLVLGIIAIRMVAWAHAGLEDPLDHFTHAVVAALFAGITTSLWYAAIVNASD
jgi:hypothetical protein